MAKHGVKTDAFGNELNLDPSTFGANSDRTTTPRTTTPPSKPGKSLTRNISITLQEEAIEKLNELAEKQDISKSKVINRWLMSL